MTETALSVKRRPLSECLRTQTAVDAGVLLVCLAMSLAVLFALAWVAGADPLLILFTLLDGAAGSSLALTSTLQEMVPITLTGLAFYGKPD